MHVFNQFNHCSAGSTRFGSNEVEGKANAPMGFITICLLSDVAVKVRCEMQAQLRGAVQLVYHQEL